MTRLTNTIILLSIAILFIYCNKEQNEVFVPKPHTVDQAEKTILSMSNDLGYSCFSTLSKKQKEKKNLILSPINAALSFNILLQASGETTTNQIKQFLHIEGLTDSSIIIGFDKLNKLFSEIDENTNLIGSNKIATHRNLLIEKEFENFISKRNYIDIVKDENAGFINTPISNINESSENVFQMINAIEFNAKVKDLNRIEELPFYKTPGESSFIKMIVAESVFNYYSDLTIQAVELPLGRGNFNIMLIVPQGQKTIEELTEKLDDRLLKRIRGKYKMQSMEVYLPMMDLSDVETYTSVLTKSRIYNCFNEKRANFSKLSMQTSTYMSDFEQIVHFSLNKTDENTFSKNNELGSSGLNKSSFLIDHPFIFIVYEKYSDAIIFLGKITEL